MLKYIDYFTSLVICDLCGQSDRLDRITTYMPYGWKYLLKGGEVCPGCAQKLLRSRLEQQLIVEGWLNTV